MTQEQRIATFEISGISVPLPQNWYYHDEGASKLDLSVSLNKGAQTIEGRSLEIVINHLTRYNTEVKGMELEQAKQEILGDTRIYADLVMVAIRYGHTNGRCLRYGPINFGQGDETHIHLLYLDEGREDINLKTRAHEEQHALSYIPGAIELLEQKIAEEHKTPIYFSKIKDPELAADCNAVHALTLRNMDLMPVCNYTAKDDPAVTKRFKRAMYIYKTGDYSGLGFATNQLSSSIQRFFNKKRVSPK